MSQDPEQNHTNWHIAKFMEKHMRITGIWVIPFEQTEYDVVRKRQGAETACAVCSDFLDAKSTSTDYGL